MPSEYEARQLLRDAEMRRVLWEWLWSQTSECKTGGRPVPCAPSDEAVKADLERILLPEPKGIFRLFKN